MILAIENNVAIVLEETQFNETCVLRVKLRALPDKNSNQSKCCKCENFAFFVEFLKPNYQRPDRIEFGG